MVHKRNARTCLAKDSVFNAVVVRDLKDDEVKTKAVKQAEALERIKNSTYENSKAKRLGTATEAEWLAAKEARLNRGKS